MTTKIARHRPHCVDLAPGAFKSTGHSYATRKFSASQRSGQAAKRSLAPVQALGLRGRPAGTAGRSMSGAVRIAASPPQPPRFGHTTKLIIALSVVAAGILWTTASTGTDVVKPEPVLVRASIPTPTFFFDDAADALNAHFSDASSARAAIELAAVDPTGNGGSSASRINVSDTAATARAAAEDSAVYPTDFSAVSDTEFGAGFEPDFDPLDTLPESLVPEPASSYTRTRSPLVSHPSLEAQRTRAEAPDNALKTVVAVAPGNTLSGILNEHGVTMEQMPRLLTDEIVVEHLTNLTIGQELEILQLDDGSFHSLSTRVGNDRRITVSHSANGFAVASIDLPVEKERVVTSGTIEQSLYLAAAEADLKQSTIMELADIFQWELDFARDIRKGDQFSLVYDRLYRDGRYIGDGDILAAEFKRGGRIHRAVRFTTDDGVTSYYSPDGQSKRRTFMRHPVDVVRITSRFNPNRLHPVLHQIRAHRGVDYGSPYGSPIYATADGKVSFSGSKNAYGKTVILQHGSKFSTLYAHMSKISGKSVTGAKVKQGDVIGYVGNSGRVTGTHLHYEFRVNNEQIDPLKVELPAAQPLDSRYMADLKSLSEEMTAQMHSVLAELDNQVAAVSGTFPANVPLQ